MAAGRGARAGTGLPGRGGTAATSVTAGSNGVRGVCVCAGNHGTTCRRGHEKARRAQDSAHVGAWEAKVTAAVQGFGRFNPAQGRAKAQPRARTRAHTRKRARGETMARPWHQRSAARRRRAARKGQRPGLGGARTRAGTWLPGPRRGHGEHARHGGVGSGQRRAAGLRGGVARRVPASVHTQEVGVVLGLRYGGSTVARLRGNAHLAGSWTTGSTQWRGEAGDRRGRAVQNCYAEGVDRGAGVRQGFRSGSGVSSSG